jgi:hypothetical protein
MARKRPPGDPGPEPAVAPAIPELVALRDAITTLARDVAVLVQRSAALDERVATFAAAALAHSQAAHEHAVATHGMFEALIGEVRAVPGRIIIPGPDPILPDGYLPAGTITLSPAQLEVLRMLKAQYLAVLKT